MADFAVNHAQISQTGDTMFSGYLNPELAQDYFAEAEKISVVQRIARKIPLGTTGVKIPHWTGDVSASWVGEGDMKPITKGGLTSQTVEPSKIATIFVASAETVRANPAGYLTTMRTKVATAIAVAFDNAILHGTSTPFGAYVDQTTNSVSLVDPLGAGQASNNDAYTALNNGLKLLLADSEKWTGTLLSAEAEPIFNAAKDANGRPLFLEIAIPAGQNQAMREGTILGRPTFVGDNVVAGTSPTRTLGYQGDFSQIVWGQVGGLSFDVTDQATLNLGTFAAPDFVSLWQHNLVAVRVEAEYGALVNDVDAFVKLTETETA